MEPNTRVTKNNWKSGLEGLVQGHSRVIRLLRSPSRNTSFKVTVAKYIFQGHSREIHL